MRPWLILFSLLCAAHARGASTLTLTLPATMQVQSASAAPVKLAGPVAGKVEGNKVTFTNLLPDTPYEVRLVLKDGTVLQGIDLAWHSVEPGKAHPAALDDDDRKQLNEIIFEVKAFENKRNLLHLVGDHDRAVALAELIRDSEFHSDTGGEIIWRIEVWYFKNQHGGWERVPQSSRVVRRERFTEKAAFEKASKTKWIPAIGGLKVGKDQEKTIEVDPLKPPAGVDKPKPRERESEEHD